MGSLYDSFEISVTNTIIYFRTLATQPATTLATQPKMTLTRPGGLAAHDGLEATFTGNRRLLASLCTGSCLSTTQQAKIAAWKRKIG